MNCPTGLVIATRNNRTIGNKTPGSWLNHCGVVYKTHVIEGQVEVDEQPGFVLAVPLKNFLNRYPFKVGFRIVPSHLDFLFATEVARYLGDPYHAIKNNCCTPIVEAWETVMGRRFKCRHPLVPRPDDLRRASVQSVWGPLVNHHDWQMPESWTLGWTINKSDLEKEGGFMTLEMLKKLEGIATGKIQGHYKSLGQGELQSVAVAFQFLNEEFETYIKESGDV